MKNKKWATIKNLLITYLATSKMLYWFTTVSEAVESDFYGVAETIVNRILSREVLVIGGVVLAFVLQKFFNKLAVVIITKFGQKRYAVHLCYAVIYIIFYVLVFGLVFVYLFVLDEFFDVQIFSFFEFLPTATIAFFAVAIISHIKNSIKVKKGDE